MFLRTIAGCCWLYVSLTTCCYTQEPQAANQQPVHSLTGVDIPSVGWVPFRPMALHDQSTGSETQHSDPQTILSSLSGRYGWERFSSDSLAAPVVIEIESLNYPSGEPAGYLAYSAFIAYARLDMLRDRNLMEATFGPEADSVEGDRVLFKRLSTGDTDTSPDPLLEGHTEKPAARVLMRLPLFNRVVISGVVDLLQSSGADAIQLHWLLDPNFTKDLGLPDQSTSSTPQLGEDDEQAELQNTWVKLVPNDVGRLVPSEPKPYQGLGGYTSVTPTGLADDQLLIETCMVIHEPPEWFSGSKFLRARLLVSLQESAKSFRRKLSKLGD